MVGGGERCEPGCGVAVQWPGDVGMCRLGQSPVGVGDLPGGGVLGEPEQRRSGDPRLSV